MCGIYGSTIRYSDQLIGKKLAVFKFRGPDYTGIKCYPLPDTELVLGHNRLAIIDLESRSNQPFDYSDTLSVVFNGEIYNYQELKENYFKDRIFSTTSDTEVLCAMYERFGIECTKYLNGMFAFVVYDKSRQLLFGARDRLGKKPFFYHLSSRGFEFASQLFPLCVGNHYSVDEKARRFYFLLQYVPDPYSIFGEVRKLKAGEQFVYNLDTKVFKATKYWDVDANSCGFTVPVCYDEALENVDWLLSDAVSKRLVADVPVGVFLSGGIDSSLITSYVSKLNPKVEAFSVSFDEAEYNESFYSRSVAEHLGINYHPILCHSQAVLGMLDSIFLYYDEPLGDSSALPTSLLAQEVRKHVTVALGGDGGDEIFWGYGRYMSIVKYGGFYKLPYFIRRLLAVGIRPTRYGRYAEAMSLRDLPVLYAYMHFIYGKQALNYDASKCFYSMEEVKYLKGNDTTDKAISNFDLKTYLNYAINTKVDRATMRSALELRSPLMDYRLVEYSRLLPWSYLYTKRTGQKRILRDLLYRNVPKELFLRKKQGFGLPVDLWFRKELKDCLLDVVNIDSLRQLPELEADGIIELRDNHIAGKEDNSTLLWYVFSYLLWERTYKQVCCVIG